MAIKQIRTRVHARGGDGGPINGQDMLRELDMKLTSLVGPFKQQAFVPQAAGKFNTVVHAGKPKMGNAVYKLLESLGFSANKLTVSGYYGGARYEIGGEVTVVNYSHFNGVISITTQLKFKG